MGFRISTAVFLFAALLLAGCASHKEFYLEIRPGKSDYVTVVCAPEGNPLGFSVEFPRCYCNGGVLLSHVVRPKEGGGYLSRFELRRGYLLEDGSRTLIVSRDGQTIDWITVGGRPVTRKGDPEAWRRNQESFADLMVTFGARLYEVEAMCAAEGGGRRPLVMNLKLEPAPGE